MTDQPPLTEESPAGPALYRRIRSDLEEAILSGQWLPGHRIPFEHELMERYGCARMTVSRALTELVATGLIERRRKAGTFVAQRKMESAVLQIPNLAEEITSRGRRYGYQLLSQARRLADARTARDHGVSEGADILEVRSLHLADDVPLMSEQRLIHVAAVPAVAAVSFAETSPGAWLLANVPWTEAEHHISAINPDKRTAGELGISRADACLSIERRTWRNGATVTSARQVFRGDMYHLAAHFVPGG